jgi:hypothetical protein
VPETACAPLDRLAQACVREFDRFRAPMSAPERARRMAARLTARQIEHLERWGYPYVFEDFRFHMTLTGPLAPPKRARVLQLLCDQFEQSTDSRSLTIDRIVIARQMQSGAPFQVVREALLGHSVCRPFAYSG